MEISRNNLVSPECELSKNVQNQIDPNYSSQSESVSFTKESQAVRAPALDTITTRKESVVDTDTTVSPKLILKKGCRTSIGKNLDLLKVSHITKTTIGSTRKCVNEISEPPISNTGSIDKSIKQPATESKITAQQKDNSLL